MVFHFKVFKESLKSEGFLTFHGACVLCNKMKSKPLIMKRSKGISELDSNGQELTIEGSSRQILCSGNYFD